MKQIYHLITGIAMIMFVIACSSEDNMPNNSKIGFQRKGIDLVENHGIVEVPIVVEGLPKNLASPIKLSITTTDETAVTDKDYKLIDHEITIHKNGIYGVKVEMIDNEELNENDTPLTFKLNIINSNNSCNIRNTECTCYIIDNEVKEVKKEIVLSDAVEGYYTLSAQLVENGKLGETVSSKEGTIEIRPTETKGVFTISPIILVKDDKVAVITKSPIKATLLKNKNLQIQSEQKVGVFGNGQNEAIILFASLNGEEFPEEINFTPEGHDYVLNKYTIIVYDTATKQILSFLGNLQLHKVADLETN